MIFDIRIFSRFLNEYPNILLRPYCLKMTDKSDTNHVSLNLFHTLLHFTELKLKNTQQKLKNTQQMSVAMKSVAFVIPKNAQNCSKRIIGQKIDIRILP